MLFGNRHLNYPQFQKVPIPSYTNAEYQQHLNSDSWKREDTDHLFDLCQRFDLRFVLVNDRWDRQKCKARPIEELKSRYYEVCGILTKVATLFTISLEANMTKF
jgi:DNA methyltransferase 1-associated protein 1